MKGGDNMRGGEIIIDLKNKNHVLGTAVNHPGIYSLIKSTRKPVRLCNFVLAGSEKYDICLTSLESVNNTYKAVIILASANYNIDITDTDDVTFSLGE